MRQRVQNPPISDDSNFPILTLLNLSFSCLPVHRSSGIVQCWQISAQKLISSYLISIWNYCYWSGCRDWDGINPGCKLGYFYPSAYRTREYRTKNDNLTILMYTDNDGLIILHYPLFLPVFLIFQEWSTHTRQYRNGSS